MSTSHQFAFLVVVCTLYSALGLLQSSYYSTLNLYCSIISYPSITTVLVSQSGVHQVSLITITRLSQHPLRGYLISAPPFVLPFLPLHLPLHPLFRLASMLITAPKW